MAVVAIASDAKGDDCTTIDAGSHAVVAALVPVGRMDVRGAVSVALADTTGKVAVAKSVASPVVKVSPTDAVGVAVTPVSDTTAGEPVDVGTTRVELLSEVVIPLIGTPLAVLVGGTGGADVITIEAVPEEPPVGTAVKLIPEVFGGGVAVTETTGIVAESVAEFKTPVIDESTPGLLDVGAELGRTFVTAVLISLMMDDRTFGVDTGRTLVTGPTIPSVVVGAAGVTMASVVVGAAGATSELDVGAAIIEDTTEETSDTILDTIESTIAAGAVEVGAAAGSVAADSAASVDELLVAAAEAVMTPLGPNVMGLSEDVAAAPEVSSVLGVVVGAD